jgi:NADH-quinone oxidoreductase subunit A
MPFHGEESDSMTNPYIPVIIIFAIGLILGGALSALSALAGPKKKYGATKYEPYECGVPAIGSGRDKMSVKFYLTALLFILFDIETIFLYLWATAFRQLGWFGVIEILVFVGILVAGFVYVLKRGALEWD